MRMVALVLGILALVSSRAAEAQTISVAEVGSFHVGGRAVSLTGLPTRDVVFTAGSAPIKVDPNGDFEVEQMYVSYTKLAQPKARYPLLLWHGGGLEMQQKFYRETLKLNVVSLPVLNASPQALGWFKKKIESLADFKGQKCRQTGVAAEIYNEMGMRTVIF